MPNLEATEGESSMSSFPTLTLPWYSSASFSTIGARTLQGPHQTALKSRRNGTFDLSTSASKFKSLISRTFAPAMGLDSPLDFDSFQTAILIRLRCRSVDPGSWLSWNEGHPYRPSVARWLARRASTSVGASARAERVGPFTS